MKKNTKEGEDHWPGFEILSKWSKFGIIVRLGPKHETKFIYFFLKGAIFVNPLKL